MRALAWQAGRQAALDNMQRVVPSEWQRFKSDWLDGYDDRASDVSNALRRL